MAPRVNDDAPPPALPGSEFDPNPTVPPLPGTCTVKVTGDATEQWTGRGGPSAVSSDHWMSEDDKRNAAIGMGATDVEAEMKKDPFNVVLTLNCRSGTNSISLAPQGASTDIPMRPAKYPIVADKPAPGQVGLLGEIGGVYFKAS